MANMKDTGDVTFLSEAHKKDNSDKSELSFFIT